MASSPEPEQKKGRAKNETAIRYKPTRGEIIKDTLQSLNIGPL
jgi:hypothetical protein